MKLDLCVLEFVPTMHLNGDVAVLCHTVIIDQCIFNLPTGNHFQLTDVENHLLFYVYCDPNTLLYRALYCFNATFGYFFKTMDIDCRVKGLNCASRTVSIMHLFTSEVIPLDLYDKPLTLHVPAHHQNTPKGIRDQI